MPGCSARPALLGHAARSAGVPCCIPKQCHTAVNIAVIQHLASLLLQPSHPSTPESKARCLTTITSES